MTTIPTVVVTPAQAAGAYARTDQGVQGFGTALQGALERAVRQGHEAETQATQAMAGQGNITEVVTALAQAELTLQTATVVRDRVVQAYQDIIRMPI